MEILCPKQAQRNAAAFNARLVVVVVVAELDEGAMQAAIHTFVGDLQLLWYTLNLMSTYHDCASCGYTSSLMCNAFWLAADSTDPSVNTAIIEQAMDTHRHNPKVILAGLTALDAMFFGNSHVVDGCDPRIKAIKVTVATLRDQTGNAKITGSALKVLRAICHDSSVQHTRARVCVLVCCRHNCRSAY